jgi:hypothetical protein
MPAIDLSNSPLNCVGVPVPPEAKLSAPGLALASAISSLTLVTGSDGGTTTRFG